MGCFFPRPLRQVRSHTRDASAGSLHPAAVGCATFTDCRRPLGFGALVSVWDGRDDTLHQGCSESLKATYFFWCHMPSTPSALFGGEDMERTRYARGKDLKMPPILYAVSAAASRKSHDLCK